MGKKIRSAKGVMVDFDLLRIQETLAAKPTTQSVKARQDFVEKRLRRRTKQSAIPPPAPAVTSGGTVEVEKIMPRSETPKVKPPAKEETDNITKTTTRRSQRARPSTSTKEEKLEDGTSQSDS